MPSDNQRCPCCGAWLAIVGQDIVLMEDVLEWERERDMDSRVERERERNQGLEDHADHPHMLGQCITWAEANRISKDGP